MTFSATLNVDSVTDQLRTLIFDGTLPIGFHLTQEGLAKRFSVSRIPVREALHRLRAEGLIVHTAFHGAVVATQSITELLETLEIRTGLELRALKLAIPNMTERDIEAARSILDSCDKAETPENWTEYNLAFHLRLYEPSRKPRLVSTIERTVRSIDSQLRARQSSTVGKAHSKAEHHALLAACQAGKLGDALKLLESHINHTQTLLLKRLEALGGLSPEQDAFSGKARS